MSGLPSLDSSPPRRAFLSCRLFALAICIALFAAGKLTATDCPAIAGPPPLTPEQAPSVDGKPVSGSLNACTCVLGICNGFCGPVTTCILQGNDPPINSEMWRQNAGGTPSHAFFTSGKCGPSPLGVPTCETGPAGPIR